jgi:hypothetical protein
MSFLMLMDTDCLFNYAQGLSNNGHLFFILNFKGIDNQIYVVEFFNGTGLAQETEKADLCSG